MEAYYQAFGTFRIVSNCKIISTYFPDPNLSINEIEIILKNNYNVISIFWE